MYLSFVLAVVIASLVLINAEKRPSSYRRRHLWPYESVCSPTSEPTAGDIKVPTPTETPPVTPPYGKGKGGKGSPGPGPSPKPGPGPNPGGKGGKGSGPGPSPGGKGGSGPGPSPGGKGGSGPGPSPGGKGSSTGGGPGCSHLRKLATSLIFGSSSNADTTNANANTNTDTDSKSEKEYAKEVKAQRELMTISLNATLAPYGSYALPGFRGSVVLTWPDYCFSALVVVTNFIPSCPNCNFVVTDGSFSCASIPSVVPFIDPTEIPYNPYNNVTVFTTDASGSATVRVAKICTGTGPQDNYERPVVLTDAQGNVAACGILAYICK